MNLPFLMVALVVAFCGCLRRQSYAKPLYEKNTIDVLRSSYADWKAVAERVSNDSNPGLARDKAIYDLMRLSDHYYEEFKAKLYVGEATGHSTFDLTSIGLSTAAGVVGGGTGQILALTDTAVKGAHGHLTERWLSNKAMRIVILAMDASRAEIRAQIHQAMQAPYKEFPIEQGFLLVARYHAAASVPNAFTYLETAAGDKKKQAELNASNLMTNRVGAPTPPSPGSASADPE